MPWTATPHAPSGLVSLLNPPGLAVAGLTPAEARALAAELVRAAGEVEPERNCHTCAHNRTDDTCVLMDPGDQDQPTSEWIDAHTDWNGMPIPGRPSCPGHAPKEGM